MLQKLKNFLNLFKQFNSKIIVSSVPNSIANDERIIRAVYSPINLHKNGKRVNNSFYKPQAGEDEVSVNRLNYSSVTFLKKIAKTFQNPEGSRNYFGFSLLKASEILNNDLRIIYTPKQTPIENPFHADIKIDYIVEKGVPLPAEVSYKIKQITDVSRFYIDPKPDLNEWQGDELI